MINEIRKDLFKMQDLKYREFTAKLIPNVEKERIIGIRTPIFRKYVKDFFKKNTEKAMDFLENLPHHYFEENNMHSFIIENINDFELTMEYTEKFLPYIDNWATCDSFSPKIFKKHSDEVYSKILTWLNSDDTYVVRYGIGLLLSNYLDENFKIEHLEIVSGIKSDEYYVNMMIAWYFATALAKQYESAIKIIEENKLDIWTHNKSIQKSVESRRISNEIKEYLRTLRRKMESGIKRDF